MTTYDRKYYLIREIKKAGFSLTKKNEGRTILVPPHLVAVAKTNKHVLELQRNYQYGVQTIIA